MWKRSDISSCNCNEKPYRHVHCLCNICCGRATDRKTEIRHWQEARRANTELSTTHSIEHVELSDSPKDMISCGSRDDNCEPMELDDEAIEIENNTVPVEVSSPSTDSTSRATSDEKSTCSYLDPEHSCMSDKDENLNQSNPIKKLIIDAVLNALKIQKTSGVSLQTLEDILEYGKQLLLDSRSFDGVERDILIMLWPKTWSEVEQLLKQEGYHDATQYYICFCYETKPTKSDDVKIKYTGKYSLMTGKDEECVNCGRKGSIVYYYLGLQTKVKNWFRDENMCKKMLSHWDERHHWLGKEETWPNKKEMWDGERWIQLQWFWDPSKTWIVPCRCKFCHIPIPANHLAESENSSTEGIKIVECPECLETFCHLVKTATGCPYNLALIGHWDGWQAFKSSTRSCGSLEVTIANMQKKDRNHTDEVYVLGFIPMASTPKIPQTYDPFLQPLMDDLCEGFIQGFDINIPQEPMLNKVRVLLLCWSGDHPGQCEIGKLLNQGKCPCRRCKLVGQHLPGNETNNHMYYGDNRVHYRHNWECRDISLMLTDLCNVEAESRASIRKKMSSEKGITGISLLHKFLYPLYGFDILKDLVFDVFHTVCLNVVKNQTERLLDCELVDKKTFDSEIVNFPWPSELKSGRMPKTIKGYKGSLGKWKAEGLQKFSFPMADCLLVNKLESLKEQEIQQLISRITEMHFNTGRYGWTNNMIEEHYKLAWRLNILIEECQGLHMCTISLHNLLHIHEDIIRFSATDNYWCAVFERAVKLPTGSDLRSCAQQYDLTCDTCMISVLIPHHESMQVFNRSEYQLHAIVRYSMCEECAMGYIKRSTNCRGIEKTFAFAETRREFLKPLSNLVKDKEGKINKKVGIASSVYTAKVNSKHEGSGQSFLLGAMENISMLEDDDRIQIANTINVTVPHVQEFAFFSKNCFLSNRGFEGIVCSHGESVIALIEQSEVVMKIDKFLSLKGSGGSYQLLAKGNLYNYVYVSERQLQKHFWSGFSYVYSSSLNEPVFITVESIKRKVFLYKQDQASEIATVVDYQRCLKQLPFDVIVPVYPEKGDMLLVQGAEFGDIWYGHARSVDVARRSVDVYFYVENPRLPNIYVRETVGHASRNTVPWDSLLGIADGSWLSTSQWQRKY